MKQTITIKEQNIKLAISTGNIRNYLFWWLSIEYILCLFTMNSIFIISK